MLLSRFVNFYRELIRSPKFSIRFLARLQEKDLRTSMGNTLHYLRKECGIAGMEMEKLTPQKVKSCVRYVPTTGADEWKVKLAQELQAIRSKQMVVEGFTNDEMEELFCFLCTK